MDGVGGPVIVFIDGSCVSQGTEGFAAHDKVNLEAPVGRDLAIKDEARLRLGHPNAALVYRSSIGSPHRLKLGRYVSVCADEGRLLAIAGFRGRAHEGREKERED